MAASASIGKRPAAMSDKSQERVAGYLFVAPALGIVLLFVIIPILFAFVMSFTDWKGNQAPSEAQGVGLANYSELLLGTGFSRTQTQFFTSLRNTFWYTVIVVPIQTALSLLLAVIVNQKFLRFRGFFRTAFYFPSITASVVVGVIFLYLFNRNGIINGLLGGLASLFGSTYTPITWLDNSCGIFRSVLGACNIRQIPQWMRDTQILEQPLWQWLEGPSVALFAIMLLAIWTTIGTMMLIYLAALQDIPTPLYEAASVDGATPMQQFWQITVPLLRPTTFFIVTIGLIGCFQVFDQIFVISRGEPRDTTLTIAWIAFRNAFYENRAGLGTATAFVLFVIIGIFTIIQRRILGGRADA